MSSNAQPEQLFEISFGDVNVGRGSGWDAVHVSSVLFGG